MMRIVPAAFLLGALFSLTSSFPGEPASKNLLREINPPRASDHLIVIRGATVLDGKGGPPLTGAVVVVHGAKIATIGREPGLAPNAEIVDASGMTVLPGFIDSHFHIER